MNYAIKTLMKQSSLIKDLLEQKQEEYDNCMIESMMDVEMFENDIFNLNKQLKELIEAIEILRNK